jgi:hypothetical protein
VNKLIKVIEIFSTDSEEQEQFLSIIINIMDRLDSLSPNQPYYICQLATEDDWEPLKPSQRKTLGKIIAQLERDRLINLNRALNDSANHSRYTLKQEG